MTVDFCEIFCVLYVFDRGRTWAAGKALNPACAFFTHSIREVRDTEVKSRFVFLKISGLRKGKCLFCLQNLSSVTILTLNTRQTPQVQALLKATEGLFSGDSLLIRLIYGQPALTSLSWLKKPLRLRPNRSLVPLTLRDLGRKILHFLLKSRRLQSRFSRVPQHV